MGTLCSGVLKAAPVLAGTMRSAFEGTGAPISRAGCFQSVQPVATKLTRKTFS